MFRSMIQLRYPTGRYQKRWEKPWKNNIQMLAEHSAQLNIRNPKLRRHRNHCGFLCACSLKQVYKGIQRSVELRKIKISFTSNKEAWTLHQIGIESILVGVWQKQLLGFLFVKDILPGTRDMLVIFGASKAGYKLYDGSVRKSIMRHYQWIIYIYIYIMEPTGFRKNNG